MASEGCKPAGGTWNGGGRQPNVPEVVKFVADYRAATKKTPSARDWFGYVSMHSVRLAAEKAKSLEGPKLAVAMEDMELPPDVALQPGQVRYRKGDHELMPNIFVGKVHPPKGNPDNVFTVATLVPGEQAAGTVVTPSAKRRLMSRHRLRRRRIIFLQPFAIIGCRGGVPRALGDSQH